MLDSLPQINLSVNVLFISRDLNIVCFFLPPQSRLFGHQSSAHQGTGITGNSAINCWHARSI